jgi:diacylglycerol kinase
MGERFIFFLYAARGFENARRRKTNLKVHIQAIYLILFFLFEDQARA